MTRAEQQGCIAKHDERTAEVRTRAQVPQGLPRKLGGGGDNLRRALTAEAACEGEVLGLNSDTLSVDSSQVGVFEEGDEIGLASLLKGEDGRGLEPKIRLEVLSNFTNKTLERELADEEIRALLVFADFTESDGTGPEAMRLLDTTRGDRSGLLGSLLSGELLSWSFATSRLAGGLLGAGHLDSFSVVCDAESWVWRWDYDH